MTASEFIAQHTGICYCEAVIAPDGNIEYAIPGHVYKLIEVANESRDELDRMMPMRAAPLHWLIEHTGYGAVWYDQFILPHHKNRRMEARDFSRERKCAAIKDANTEHIQAECIFFAFLPVFCQKVLSAKTFF